MRNNLGFKLWSCVDYRSVVVVSIFEFVGCSGLVS